MESRLNKIFSRINNAAARYGRDTESIKLVAVSKTVPETSVKKAIDAGVTIFGENYIQEALDKIEAISAYPLQKPITWHFIGHLQSNKAKHAVKLFDLIHSVDSLKLAMELDKQAKKINKIQAVLIQVNISMEKTKSGVYEGEAISLLQDAASLKNLSVKGLMTMPPFYNEPEKARPYFKALRNLRDDIKANLPDISLDELSMGMTGDFEVAIEEGATFVRIGTAIFGERD